MWRSLRPRSAYDVMAALALFLVVAGGTAYALAAANSVDSASIIDGEVRNRDVAANAIGSGKVIADSLRGEDIDESTLGAVPNSNRLGGQPASAFVPRCGLTAAQGGAIHGFAHVVISEVVPLNDTAADPFRTNGVHTVYNCSGGAVEAYKDDRSNVVNLRFVGQPAKLAFVVSTKLPPARWTVATTGVPGKWEFIITARDRLTDFNIVLP
jgi:hypothetical protein